MAHLSKYSNISNYKIPPESTGGAVLHYEHIYLEVSGALDGFSLPATFTATGGITGDVLNIWELPSANYRLLIVINSTDHNYSDIENLDQVTLDNVESQPVVDIESSDRIVTSSSVIVDAENPENTMTVDRTGASYVRFREGEPIFNAYGSLQTSPLYRVDDFMFKYNTKAELMQEISSGTGTVTFLPAESSVAMDIGDQSGDSVKKASNRYYRYFCGSSLFLTMSIICGDSGKNGVTRRWGLFDDENGLFFQQTSSGLAVVIRSSVSGSVVDTVIPQSQWNVDRLDGSLSKITNLSGIDLDETKNNIYWMDFQWHGAGLVRFGVVGPNGKRIVAHQEQHANKLDSPYMSTPDLPIRLELFNSSNTISPSRMKSGGIGLYFEGEYSKEHEIQSSRILSWTMDAPVESTGSADEVVLGHFRAGAMFAGATNREKTIPRTLHYHVSGGPVAITIYAHSDVSGGTWSAAHTLSPAEINTTATVNDLGHKTSQHFLDVGASRVSVSESFNLLGQHLTTMSDGSAGTIYTITAKAINEETVNILGGIDWIDL